MNCPCGSGLTFGDCCEPVLQGQRAAATPEQLMRARYTAFATGNVDFIHASHEPGTRGELDRSATESWSKQSEWLGFELLGTEGGGDGEDEGTVEFTARYRLQGNEYAHHETAIFRRIDGQWFFVDGEMAAGETFRRAEPKIGRNEPCPCGSGKKYKKCHGQRGALSD